MRHFKLTNIVLYGALLLGLFALARHATALSTSATTGFTRIATTAGTPTGVPGPINSDTTCTDYDSTNDVQYVADPTGKWKRVSGNYTVASAAAAVSAVNTVTETTLCSLTAPGNLLGTGARFRLAARGALTTKASAPGTFTVKVKYGGNSVTVVNAATLGTGASGVPFVLDVAFTSSASAAAQTVVSTYTDGSGSSSTGTPILARGSTATDSTASHTVDVTWTFGTAAGSNFVTLEGAYLELVRSN